MRYDNTDKKQRTSKGVIECRISFFIDDYPEDGGPEAARPLCRFYHDPLCSERYETIINKLASYAFTESSHVILNPYRLRQQRLTLKTT